MSCEMDSLFGSTSRVECTSVKREAIFEYISFIALTFGPLHIGLRFLKRQKA